MIETRVAFTIAMFPKEVSNAALYYISLVGTIALDQVPLPGVIDDPKLINLADMPLNTAQEEAHKKLLEWTASKFNVSSNDLFKAKQAILDACDPLPIED